MKPAPSIYQIEGRSSLDEAVRRLMDELGPDKDVYCQFHRLAPYQGFPVHKHFTTNEWTVICNAEFYFVTREQGVDHVQLIRSPNKVTIIHIPVGICHTIRSRESGLKYAVIKDGPDDFNWC